MANIKTSIRLREKQNIKRKNRIWIEQKRNEMRKNKHQQKKILQTFSLTINNLEDFNYGMIDSICSLK